MIGVAPPSYDPAAPTTASTLPVGARPTVRAYVGELLRRHRRAFLFLVTVNTVAVIASMAGPYLLGGLVERVSDDTRELRLGLTAALFVLALLVQAVFVREVRLRGAVLGERMLADLREDFLVRSVGLPPGVLERAWTATCSPGSPRTSTGSPTPCARPCPSWRSVPCGWCCCWAAWWSRHRPWRPQC